MPDGVAFVIRIRDAYAFSVVHVSARGTQPFSVDLGPARVYKTTTGSFDDPGTLRAAECDGAWAIDAEVTGVFAQLPVHGGNLRFGKGPGLSRAEYGVRFHPFCSSVLRLNLRVPEGIASVTVEDHAAVRLLWDHATVAAEEPAPTIVLAHSESGWRQTFRYAPAAPAFGVSLPVVASRRFLFRVVIYPLVAFAGAVVGVFAADQLLDTEGVIAAVGAAATLLLREAVASERAHQMNLGQAILGIEGALVVAWALTLSLLPAWSAVAFACALIVAGGWLVAQTGAFEYRGRLPGPVARWWGSASLALERWRAWRRKRLGVRPFDHWDRGQ